jgi:sarcosine oxidase subunit alpha
VRTDRPLGRARARGRREIDGAPAEDWVAGTLAELEGMPNVHLRTRTMVAGVYDHGYVIAYERVSDHAPQDDAAPPALAGPRGRR